MTGREWGLIGTLSLLWGGAFFFIALGLEGFPPNTLVLVRMAIASLPLLLLVRLTGERLPRDAASWASLALLGFLNVALPFILFTWGQTRISSGLASVLNATTPLWGVLAAHFLTHDERATPARVAGALLGFAGVGVMIGTDLSGGFSGSLLAQIACLVATLCFALAVIYARRFDKSGMSPVVVATGQVVTAAIIMLPIALITDAPWQLPMPGNRAILGTVALALLSTSLSYVLFFRLLKSAGVNNTLLIAFLMPIVAIALGAAFLGEVMAPRHFAGIALIALGLAVIDGRPFRALARTLNVP